MKGKELGQLILERLLIVEDGRLVMHDSAHVDVEGLHILADEDPVLLGLIPISIKSSRDGCSGRGWVEDCPASPCVPTGIPNLD